MGVTVVIAVFNTTATLVSLVERLLPVLHAQTAGIEILLVNDGSRDRSWEVINRLARDHPEVRGIDLMRNYGQHNALLCGIRAATHEVIVTMDDDLQHPPEAIPQLLQKLDEGYDVVYGVPEKLAHEWWRNCASRVVKRILRVALGDDLVSSVAPFRAFRTRVREAFARYQSSFVSIDVLLSWGTTRMTAIRVPYDRRAQGVSNYTVRTLMVYTLNLLTGFSTLPLRLASLLGFVTTALGVLTLLYVVGRQVIQGGAPAGFPFLASIISIFSGVQLFALGIIGEYLARIHFRMIDRPPYVMQAGTGRAVDPQPIVAVRAQAHFE